MMSLLGVIPISILLAVPVAHSASEMMFSWGEMKPIDFAAVVRGETFSSLSNQLTPQFDEKWISKALDDPEHRIANLFQVPKVLRPNVEFWLRVYTQYSTHDVVFFDDQHPEIVYEVLDFRELDRTARNRVVYEILRNRRIEKKLRAYKEAFRDLQVSGVAKTPEARAIVQAVKRSPHKHSFTQHLQNLRTQTGQRDNIVRGLMRADALFPIMERLFVQYGLPSELTRLPLLESSFQERATSRVGAKGVWQFMPATGKEFMLVNEGYSIDERLSPFKSTIAAAKLIQRHHKVLHQNWAWTITSYNYGIRPLQRVAKQHRDLESVGRLIKSCNQRVLGWAGRSYYAGFLAIIHAEAYRELFYGRAPEVKETAIQFARIATPSNLLEYSLTHGVSIEALRRLNPDVPSLKKTLPVGFWLVLPEGSSHHTMVSAQQWAETKRRFRRPLKPTDHSG
jgi:membrane-bound lytic murein transglycosylase D